MNRTPEDPVLLSSDEALAEIRRKLDRRPVRAATPQFWRGLSWGLLAAAIVGVLAFTIGGGWQR